MPTKNNPTGMNSILETSSHPFSHLNKTADLLWLYLKSKPGGYKFFKLHPVENYIVGYFCPQLKMAIEWEQEDQEVTYVRETPMQRQQKLESCGIRFLKINRGETGNMETLMEKIDSFIDETYEQGQID